jgi:hypothetical protein
VISAAAGRFRGSQQCKAERLFGHGARVGHIAALRDRLGHIGKTDDQPAPGATLEFRTIAIGPHRNFLL